MLPSEYALGLRTPINPVCGGTPTQNPPLTDRCASSERRLNAGYTLGKNFRLRQCGEIYRTH
jgi:hypothetical protein